jgi:phosphoribosylformylglycinamidine synthase
MAPAVEQGSRRSYSYVELFVRPDLADVLGRDVARRAISHLGIATGEVRVGKQVVISPALDAADLQALAEQALRDPVVHEVAIDRPWHNGFARAILIGKLPGVTDDEGAAVLRTLEDLLGLPPAAGRRQVSTSDVYLIEKPLDEADLRILADELLGNRLVNHTAVGPAAGRRPYLPTPPVGADPKVETFDIFAPDEELLQRSRDLVLSLDLAELRAIRAYFRLPATLANRHRAGLPAVPTDCEIEILAQTWSEHCKHKEFNALIRYQDLDTGREQMIDSLFATYIRAATMVIKERLAGYGNDWLLKVFTDNAGVVRLDDDLVFVFKVETHNTPSALDPYGGAITGILGNNRDPLGTGVGGGRLLFNTNVLCFGPPGYDRPLLTGQLHPRRVLAGVRHGIEDGGNKSGVPTVNGAIVFDERYAGKPLVYCGTGGLMPALIAGRPSWEKEVLPGDAIVMAGGRVGKDGIHGATFSSVEIDRHSPRSAVQIGSPITQKMLADFLEVGRELIRCCTDNGAGGLSSSIGELAAICGGAEVQLAAVPLKYAGLRPWEIFLSESQERMTLVVPPERLAELFALAREYEVELSDIGRFTADGRLDVRFGQKLVARLDLDFLHHGVPRKELRARWRRPIWPRPPVPAGLDHGAILRQLLGSLDICSREAVIRQYDHEVKGRSVIKPLMGRRAPQDAAVMRLGFDDYRGLAISCGITPRYGDLDAYAMSAGCFDEAVRQIIAIGGRLPDPADPQGPRWSACDNFCVPDSVEHPTDNPQGAYKLAQLVRMCQALYDLATAYNVPLTSGKDSMKNDFRSDGQVISVPPTVLYSMVASLPDVRRCVTTELKSPGDVLYLLGETYSELGASAVFRLLGLPGGAVPIVRVDAALDLYSRMAEAHRLQLLESCHDLSDGGLAVAVAEAAFGGELGCAIEAPAPRRGSSDTPSERAADEPEEILTALFGESHSRFVVSVRPEHTAELERVLAGRCKRLGTVTVERCLSVAWRGRPLFTADVDELAEAWSAGLEL